MKICVSVHWKLLFRHPYQTPWYEAVFAPNVARVDKYTLGVFTFNYLDDLLDSCTFFAL